MNYIQQINPINCGEYNYFNGNGEIVGKLINTGFLTQTTTTTTTSRLAMSTNKHNRFVTLTSEEKYYNECINKTKKYIKELQNIDANIKYSER